MESFPSSPSSHSSPIYTGLSEFETFKNRQGIREPTLSITPTTVNDSSQIRFRNQAIAISSLTVTPSRSMTPTTPKSPESPLSEEYIQ